MVLAEFPRLVYASVSGYGLEGPEVGRAGYDVGAFWARSGIAATMAPNGAAPPGIRAGMGDHITGMTTVAGILAALLDRERTGRGQLVETSLLRTGIYGLGWDLGIQMRFGKNTSAQPRTTELNPMCNCYAAGDGRWFWLLGVEADRLWPKLCAALDRADLAADERFSTARGRRHHAEELVAELDAIFATATRDALTEIFDRHDVWWAPVNTLAEVLADPQAVAAGAFVEVPAGEGAPAHRAVATPVTFHGSGLPPLGGVPGLGRAHRGDPGRRRLHRRRAGPLPARRRHRLSSVELAQHLGHLVAEAAQLVAVQHGQPVEARRPVLGQGQASAAAVERDRRPRSPGRPLRPGRRARWPSGGAAAAPRPGRSPTGARRPASPGWPT